jgi:hypothetical protein
MDKNLSDNLKFGDYPLLQIGQNKVSLSGWNI